MKVLLYYSVGAGTAGATIATRLTTYGYKVLLLEAGGDAPPFLDIPLLAPLIQNTPYDWQYKTVPQENACKGLRNNVRYFYLCIKLRLVKCFIMPICAGK